MGTIESKSLIWRTKDKDRAILNNINIKLEQGHFYGIIGPNGSGKTSLLRHILRFINAESGGIYYDGRNINSIKREELAFEMSFVPQNTAVDTMFTAWEVVMMGRSPHQRRFAEPTKEDITIVSNAMERTDCLSYKDRPFSSLSGGEAQRTACARAIAQNVPWILLDEPVSSLDIKHQISIMKLLEDLNKNGNKSIAAVMHDINLAAAYCTDIIMMKEGKIFYSGSIKQALTIERLKDIYDINFISFKTENGRTYYFAEE